MTNKRLASFTSILFLLISIGLVPSSANAAGNPNCNAVDGDYIVTFAPGVNIDNEIKGAKGRVINPKFKYSAVLNGFAAPLTAAQVCAFQKRPNIENVELDSIFTTMTTQDNSTWGLDRIDSQNLPLDTKYNYTSTGSGITAYVVDTGIQINHPEFEGRASASANSDFIGDGRAGIDCNGHGTHVAGTIGGKTYGVAKTVNLVAVRVLNCSGSGSTSGVAAGLNWIGSSFITANKTVVNMSLGGGASTVIDTAVTNLINKGVTVVVAAGNSSADACKSSPARVPAAVTVAASDNQDNFARFSNRGKCVDIIAPGVNITSAWLSGAINVISGTSMASPHVAGSVARYLSVSSSPSTTNFLTTTSTAGKIKSVPRGTVNNFLYVNPAN